MVLIDRKRRLSGRFYERVLVNEERLWDQERLLELELRLSRAESPVAGLGSVQGPASSFHSGSVAPTVSTPLCHPCLPLLPVRGLPSCILSPQ